MNRPGILALFGALLIAGVAQGQVCSSAVEQNFESLELQLSDPADPQSEVVAGRGATIANTVGWTPTPPPGWEVDNSQMASTAGIREWFGWTFATRDFWVRADNQERSTFTRPGGGQNILAIADPDEYDDRANASAGDGFRSTLLSPVVGVSGFARLTVSFDSHYRQENAQIGRCTARFSDGTETVLLAYGQGTPDNLSTRNQAITRTVAIPPAAESVRIAWYMQGSNNWYWAIDNVSIVADQNLEDLDCDGLTNDEELGFGTDPTRQDTDNDGLTDFREIFETFTNPLSPDSDGDGAIDSEEVTSGTDPNDPLDFRSLPTTSLLGLAGLAAALVAASARRRK